MKHPRPFKTRLRRIFLAAAAAGTLGGTGVVTEMMPKHPATDTQIIFNEGAANQSGINISYLDQLWKQTLGLKSQESRAQDLLDAARDGDSWRVAAVLEHDIRLSQTGVTALAIASMHDHRDVIDVLLQAGVPVNGLDDAPFIAAVKAGHFDLAADYMDMAAPSASHLDDALVMAAEGGSLDLLEKIMATGVTGNIRDNAALIAAAASGHTQIVKRLFQDTYTYKSVEAIRVALPPPVTDFFDGFAAGGWSERFDGFSDYDALQDGLGRHYVYETVETIEVRTVVNPLAQDNKALRLATLNGHAETADILIAHGADSEDPHVAAAAAIREKISHIFISRDAPNAVDAGRRAQLYQAGQDKPSR